MEEKSKNAFDFSTLDAATSASISEFNNKPANVMNDLPPQAHLTATNELNNADTAIRKISMQDDGHETSGVHFRKQKRHISQNEMAPSAATLRPPSLQRISSYAPSLGGQSTTSQTAHDPPPSTAKEKSKMTRRTFATITALSYAIFLVVFALILYIGHAVVDQYPIPESFSIFMLTVGFAYFIFLYTDIRLHIIKAKKVLKERQRRMQQFEEQMAKATLQDGPLELHNQPNGSIQVPTMFDWNNEALQPLSHRYCFVTGRHGELFYLKLGAAWFGLGLLIHSILVISYQVIFLTSTEPNFVKCASVITLVFEVMFPLYSLFVLFFIFKYANVIINEYRGLARLAIMHVIGTSLALWVYTIVRETVDAIAIKNMYKNPEERKTREYFFIRGSDMINPDCPAPEVLNVIYRNFSPYLYPFIIEFCILMVGIYYIIWSNINHCPRKHSAPGHGHIEPAHSLESVNRTSSNGAHTPGADSSVSLDHCNNTVEHEAQFKSNIVVHADCHASSRGLFCGLILMVLTIVFIILFFVAVMDEQYFKIGVTVNSSFELAVLFIMIVAVIFAYLMTAKLDVNHHPMSLLDDVLLFIAIPAFFSESIFSLVPAIYNGSILNILIVVAQLVQILIQTPFIVDGIRRCSNSPSLRKRKPGRELITFLTIANVSLWVFYTFSVKTADTGDERYKYYGDVLWTILNHLSLPLIMFYRFHSSVCLVDIWRHAYEPGGH